MNKRKLIFVTLIVSAFMLSTVAATSMKGEMIQEQVVPGEGQTEVTSASKTLTSDDQASTGKNKVNQLSTSQLGTDHDTVVAKDHVIDDKHVFYPAKGLDKASLLEDKIDRIYNREEIIEKETAGVITTSRMFIEFNTATNRNAFLESLPSDIKASATVFSAIPYISVMKDERVKVLLNTAVGLVDIVKDQYQKVVDFDYNDNYSESDFTQWYSSEGRIGTWEMHDLGFNGTGIKIAVIDTGIDGSHHDLQQIGNGSNKIIAEASFVDYDFDGNADDNANDEYGHGTHVAGTAAGNGYHIGVAPDAFLINARAIDDYGWTYTSWVVSAVEWAVLEAGANIVTMSIGWDYDYYGVVPAVNDIVDWAWEQGVVVTVAAANSGPEAVTIGSPCMSPRIITVGATDSYDKLAFFSSRGPQPFGYPDPDICAPGVEVFSTIPGDVYMTASGTSMATPHAAGACALLLEAFPGANPDQVKINLMKYARDIDEPSFGQGAGLINLTASYENWQDGTAIVFPSFNDKDVFHLSPGETFSGFLDFIAGQAPAVVPNFSVSGGNLSTAVIIDASSLALVSGHQFVPLTITGPELAQLDDFYWTSVSESVTGCNMNITVRIVQAEDDAGTGSDAGDIFSSATAIPFGNYTGSVFDEDYYSVELNVSSDYSFKIINLGMVDLLTMIMYDENGTIISRTGTPWYDGVIIIAASYTGTHFIRIIATSFGHSDYSIENDYDYDYVLKMFCGRFAGAPSETMLEVTGYDMYGVDGDSDGKYEYLAINVTVNVTMPGKISIFMMLTLNKSEDLVKWIYADIQRENIVLTVTGEQNITLLLNGTHVADQQFTGTHVIYETMITDPDNFMLLVDELVVFTSKVFNSNDFTPVHLNYIDNVTHQTVDEDVDGITDYLEVNVTVDVINPLTGQPEFQAVVYTPDFGFWISDPTELDITSAGQKTALFTFDSYLFDSIDTSTVDLELVCIYSYDHPLVMGTDCSGVYILLAGSTFTVDMTAFFPNDNVAQIMSVIDSGEDTDSDGKYDFLVFNITIQIEIEGVYSIGFGNNWLWSVGSQKRIIIDELSLYEIKNELFSSGTHEVVLKISGELINSAGANGPYMIPLIEIWDSMNSIQDEELNVLTVNQYTDSDFDTASITFNRIACISYVDSNGDGKDDSLDVDIEVEVIKTGIFTITIGIVDYPSYAWFSVIMFGEEFIQEFTSTGLHNLTVRLDGTDIWLERFTGWLELRHFNIVRADGYPVVDRYAIDLFEVDWNLLPGAIPARFTYEFDDWSEGLLPYQGIVIEANVVIQRIMDYEFRIILNASGYGLTLWTYGSLEEGENTLEFHLSARDYVVYFDDGPIEIIGLEINEWWSPFFSESGSFYNTTSYQAADFDYTQPLILTGNNNHALVDDDSNGKYEKLLLTLEVEVTVADSYSFHCVITDDRGSLLIYLDHEEELAAGTQQVDIEISGYEWVVENDRPYKDVWLYYYEGMLRMENIFVYGNSDYGIAEFAYDAYTIPFLSHTDFEYNFAGWFTGDVYHAFVDTDGDELINYIDFILSVKINKTGDFVIDYVVTVEHFSGGMLIYDLIGSYTYNLSATTTGEINITLSIPAIDFYSTGIDGPYKLGWAKLTYINDGYIQDFPIFDYETDYISLSEFDRPAWIFSIEDHGLDENNNELVDSLVFNVTISIVEDDFYMLYMDLFYEGEYNLEYIGYYSSGIMAYEAGMFSIEFVIPVSSFVFRIDQDGCFEADFHLSRDGFTVDRKEYSTGEYLHSDWESLVPTSNAWIMFVDYSGNDNDNDGLFEYLMVNVQVWIVIPGNYTVKLDVFCYTELLGSYTKSIFVNDENIQISFVFMVSCETIEPAIDNERMVQLFATLSNSVTMETLSVINMFTDNIVTSEWDSVSVTTTTTTTTTTLTGTTTSETPTTAPGFTLLAILISFIAVAFVIQRRRCH